MVDRHSVLKFFNDNVADKASEKEGVHVVNNGTIVVNYGDNATTHLGCKVDDNDNLTQADKEQVNALIRSLEAKKQTRI